MVACRSANQGVLGKAPDLLGVRIVVYAPIGLHGRASAKSKLSKTCCAWITLPVNVLHF